MFLVFCLLDKSLHLLGILHEHFQIRKFVLAGNQAQSSAMKDAAENADLSFHCGNPVKRDGLRCFLRDSLRHADTVLIKDIMVHIQLESEQWRKSGTLPENLFPAVLVLIFQSNHSFLAGSGRFR